MKFFESSNEYFFFKMPNKFMGRRLFILRVSWWSAVTIASTFLRKAFAKTSPSDEALTLPLHEPLHSQEYFGKQRNHWWNDDFISLMAKRWELEKADSILDVGCGIGHWGRLLLEKAKPTTQMIGIDRELEWVNKALESAQQTENIKNRIRYLQGVAEKLPFDDGTFDIVTCQTLLIHVPNVHDVLTEMLRVVKVGGRICIVEPNNISRATSTIEICQGRNKDKILQGLEFQMICENGKAALGLGHNSVGEAIPEFMSKLKIRDIKIYLSDKCFYCIPPYNTPEETIELDQELEWAERQFWIWSMDETKKYFLAGGGTLAQFDSYWNAMMEDKKKFTEQVKNQSFIRTGGGITYLISGQKYG